MYDLYFNLYFSGFIKFLFYELYNITYITYIPIKSIIMHHFRDNI